jgi:hypothetical protein
MIPEGRGEVHPAPAPGFLDRRYPGLGPATIALEGRGFQKEGPRRTLTVWIPVPPPDRGARRISGTELPKALDGAPEQP